MWLMWLKGQYLATDVILQLITRYTDKVFSIYVYTHQQMCSHFLPN